MIKLRPEGRFNPTFPDEQWDWEDVDIRFDSFVAHTSFCYLWSGTTRSNGVGQFYIDRTWRVQARRYSLERELGYWLDPKDRVKNACGDSTCVHPGHLYIWTPKIKVRAQLTYSEAEDIRLLYSMGGVTQKTLGEKFGVTAQAINYILRGKTHVPKD